MLTRPPLPNVPFLADESGAGAIEYSLLAAFIALVVAGVLTLVGITGVDLYRTICSGINAAVGLGAC